MRGQKDGQESRPVIGALVVQLFSAMRACCADGQIAFEQPAMPTAWAAAHSATQDRGLDGTLGLGGIGIGIGRGGMSHWARSFPVPKLCRTTAPERKVRRESDPGATIGCMRSSCHSYMRGHDD